jgi:hypothetical protein
MPNPDYCDAVYSGRSKKLLYGRHLPPNCDYHKEGSNSLKYYTHIPGPNLLSKQVYRKCQPCKQRQTPVANTGQVEILE